MLFCQLCNNLLTVITTADEFYFKCGNCQKTYTPNEEDTLRYEDSNNTNLVIYKTILRNAARDPVNPIVKQKCIKCTGELLKQVRIGDDLRLINICMQCNEQWLAT